MIGYRIAMFAVLVVLLGCIVGTFAGQPLLILNYLVFALPVGFWAGSTWRRQKGS